MSPAGQSARRGAEGERLAAAAYEKRGYRLLAQNFRTRQGEVDLILQRDGSYVFAEVKTRAAGALVTGAEAVTAPKQRRVMLAAGAFLARHGLADPPLRFDVVEVTLCEGAPPRIHIIENAFSL